MKVIIQKEAPDNEPREEVEYEVEFLDDFDESVESDIFSARKEAREYAVKFLDGNLRKVSKARILEVQIRKFAVMSLEVEHIND